ncbi:unnamed protein product [Amoebophrya sp. A25]|nr:unnamed protein product [Amoebophrya sp. A25]|eukprot:GSA25T00017876001.1
MSEVEGTPMPNQHYNVLHDVPASAPASLEQQQRQFSAQPPGCWSSPDTTNLNKYMPNAG